VAAATGGMRGASFSELVAQLFFAPLLRVVALFEVGKYKRKLKEYEKAESTETDRLINSSSK